MPFNRSPINSSATPKPSESRFLDPSDYQTNTLEFAAEDLHAAKDLKPGTIGK